MTREIKFRGKNCKGEWLVGEIISLNNHKYIAPEDGGWFDFILWVPNNVFHAPDSDEYEVDQETIGQFTGLHDKKGKEIYDGDIIYSEFADKSNCRLLVGWNEQGSCFGTMDEYAYRSKLEGYDYPKFENHLLLGFLKDSKIFEVIGNIYDNPELLKEKDDNEEDIDDQLRNNN